METTIAKYVGIQFAAGKTPQDILAMMDAMAWEGPVVIANMPCCGQSFSYATIEDIPTETTSCPCGADWSWIVKYSEA